MKSFTWMILASCLVLSACTDGGGSKKKTTSRQEEQNPQTTPVPTPVPTPAPTPAPNPTTLCRTDVSIDNVPAGWTRIEAQDLITGQDNFYQMVRTTAFAAYQGEDTSLATSFDGVTNKIECADVSRGNMGITYDVILSFSAKDGKFVRFDGTSSSLVRLIYAKESGRQQDVLRQDSYAFTSLEALFQGQSFANRISLQHTTNSPNAEFRFYRLPNQEVEVRIKTNVKLAWGSEDRTKPDSLTIITRYKLRR